MNDDINATRKIILNQIVSIRSPERLTFIDENGFVSSGADQNWYRTKRQRASGCAPTVCANALWYLAATREGMASLRPHPGASERADMLRLMEAVWRYVTPGFAGVNRLSTLAEGAKRYGADRGQAITPSALEIPRGRTGRPSLESVLAFLGEALESDTPVAFLNLSSGMIKNLESWHWVTLVSADLTAATALMVDQGRRETIDIGLWLQSTRLGGGLVALSGEPRQDDRSASWARILV